VGQDKDQDKDKDPLSGVVPPSLVASRAKEKEKKEKEAALAIRKKGQFIGKQK
jgi:hypothetical protein